MMYQGNENIYGKNRQKNSGGNKKITGCYEGKKGFFVHSVD